MWPQEACRITNTAIKCLRMPFTSKGHQVSAPACVLFLKSSDSLHHLFFAGSNRPAHATAMAIKKINQGNPAPYLGGQPVIPANCANDNTRKPPGQPKQQWSGQGLTPGHANLTRRPESEPTVEWIKAAHTQPKQLRG